MVSEFFKVFFILAIATVVTACSNLAIMSQVKRIDAPADNRVLVNFVRPQVYYGDAINFEVWDGTDFVGTLIAGTMIQYSATPGEHEFMIDGVTKGGGYISGDLVVGKTYYIKPNVPFSGDIIVGVAEASDSRIKKWHRKLKTMGVDADRSKQVPQKAIDEASKKLKAFRENRDAYQRIDDKHAL